MTDTRRAERVASLIAEIRKLNERTFEHLGELEALLNEGPTVASQVPKLFAAWAQKWSAAHQGEKYVFAEGRDGGAFKRLLKALAFDDITTRMDAYLADADPWYVERRHPLAVFLKNINSIGPLTDPTTAVVGCRHVPACKSEAEHTRKRLDEVRGATRDPAF